MNSSKPMATISYNTIEFLESKLNELQRNHIISSWFFMPHKAEQDERKDHIHVWLKPNKKLDTMALQEQFREYDPMNPKKPLGCIDFVSSDIDHATLYYLHDIDYLAWKGETREYHYQPEEFHVSDSDFMDNAIYHAYHQSDFAHRIRMIQALQSAQSPSDLITNGTIPLQMASAVRAYTMMLDEDGKVYRGGRKGHA